MPALGDTVQKGQLLLRDRSDDVSGGFADYRNSVAGEALAHAQLERAKDLFEHGAIGQATYEVAQDTENKAKEISKLRPNIGAWRVSAWHDVCTQSVSVDYSGFTCNAGATGWCLDLRHDDVSIRAAIMVMF